MQVFHSIDNFLLAKQSRIALTIGNFDGLHQGHTHLLKTLRLEADKLDLPTVVLTFQQHTSVKITPETPKVTLTNSDQKSKLIKDSRLVDFLILQDFSNEFKSIVAEDFITTVLVNQLKVKLIVIGANHRFGKDRKGDLDLLKSQSLIFGFKVLGVDLLKVDGEVISSSLIRKKNV